MTNRLLCVMAMFLVPHAVGAASLWSTSSDPQARERELSEKRCATNFKRMLTFTKYWFPREDLFSNYLMYDPKKIGFRGYDLLGDLYYRGCEKAQIRPDKMAAFTWYQNAAIAHLPESQYKVGRMLFEGDGVPKDEEKGVQWLTSAALEGSKDAAQYLTRISEEVPRPISPNSYSYSSQVALQQRSNQRAEQRRAIIQDLGNIVITGAMIAGSAYLASSVSSRHAPTPTTVSRYRPVYCQYRGNVNSFYRGNVSIRISQFCQ